MTFKQQIFDHMIDAMQRAGYGDGVAHLALEKPRHKEHGDIATPVALSLARQFRKNPLQIAEDIASALQFPAELVETVTVAAPGYINLRMAHAVLGGNLVEIHDAADTYGSSDVGAGVKCQVEYVSANPTGPLVVVSARAAAVGSVLVNLLNAAGFEAEGEYYVNDFGNQVAKLGDSLEYRVQEQRGTLAPDRELGAYPGDYLKDIARDVTDADVAAWGQSDDPAAHYGKYASTVLLDSIKSDLETFGVHFDNFFLESSLHPAAVAEARDLVRKSSLAYEEDGALFFRTTEFGDEKDRVIVKSDGKPTYFLGDIAYHQTKFARGFKWVIDILGPDHHGHIPRMKAAADAIGAGADWFNALIVGWVRLIEGGKPVSMSKRAGEIITLRELIDDVGSDVAKYFFLTRRSNSPLDFDLDLARKQSDENPVYYVQYAHARIASVLRFAKEQGSQVGGDVNVSLLSAPAERDLMVHLMFFPYVVESAAMAREPHRLTTYSQELATLFHKFYHDCRVVSDDVPLTNARLFLVDATRQVLRNALTLTGVDAPASM